MLRLRRRVACCLLIALVGFAGAAVANDYAFPFDRELMLDAPPMPGTKRIPTLEIEANGAVSIELRCARLRGQANVGEVPLASFPVPQIRRNARRIGRAATKNSWRRSRR
jgi:hypothetical protein